MPCILVDDVTILIVEDDAEMGRLIGAVVASVAGQIHVCGNGLDAVDAYARHSPDWVLMDLDLPGADGIQATRLIRTSYPEARVVMVTNYDDPYLRQAAREAGACDYVSKQNLLRLLDMLR